MPIKQLNPRDQISQPAAEGLASESYTCDLNDGVLQIGGADELLPAASATPATGLQYNRHPLPLIGEG